MSKRTRRYFSAEQKVTLLKRHHLDKVPVSDICDQEKLQLGQLLQDSTLTPDNRFYCDETIRIHNEIRDELKNGIRA